MAKSLAIAPPDNVGSVAENAVDAEIVTAMMLGCVL
jgi:hypothetical protein